ncbi:MAG: putative toxin-antitoxin system toxin component, PIN family [Treponema sp.]
MKIFVDTNIIISAILFPGGITARVFSHMLTKHTIVISSYIKEEGYEVFQKKFPEKQELLDFFFAEADFEEFVMPQTIDKSDFPKMRDEADLPVLAAAVLSDSDILLTGDKDFEDIKMDRPLIFTPAEYYKLLSH